MENEFQVTERFSPDHSKMIAEMVTGEPRGLSYMPNVSNHMDYVQPGTEKSFRIASGHCLLRNTIIDLITTPKKEWRATLKERRSEAEKLYSWTEDKSYCALLSAIEQMDPSLRLDLAETLSLLGLDFTWTEDDIDDGAKLEGMYPVDAISGITWELEKCYIIYWILREKDEKTRFTPAPCRLSPEGYALDLFVEWETDGQRIAACFYKHHADSVVKEQPKELFQARINAYQLAVAAAAAAAAVAAAAAAATTAAAATEIRK
jgi:hypothetical protein